jgi:hypothetical protein
MSATVSTRSALARKTTVVVLAAVCAAWMPTLGCTRPVSSSSEAEHHEHDKHDNHEHDGHDHAHDSTAKHDHDEEDVAITEADVDMPRDYTTAIARLKTYRQQILSALADGHAHAAHRPLDEMDLVVTKLMLLARDSGVPRGEWEEVNLARRALRAQFDLAHAAIDEEKPVDRAELEKKTAAPLAQLEAIAARLPMPSATTDGKQQTAAPSAEAQP